VINRITDDNINQSTILRIGEVCEVNGKQVIVKVDELKNSSDIYYKGELLKNVAVGSYIQVRKGFLTLIGKIDGEKIVENLDKYTSERKLERQLLISLIGFINPFNKGNFEGGLKELPLIGNEAFIITNDILNKIYNLNNSSNDITIEIGKTPNENLAVNINIDKLFCSHIAIFGNTGSGKSNTLAKLYSTLCNHDKIISNEGFKKNCQFILFDFNGEYSRNECICSNKDIYKLSTRKDSSNKICIPQEILLDYNFLSIIAEATDKTQKPFIKRALDTYIKIVNADNSEEYLKNIVKNQVEQTLKMGDKEKALLLLDYLVNIINTLDGSDVKEGITWHNKVKEFMFGNDIFLASNPSNIPNTKIYQNVENVHIKDDIFDNIIMFLYIQLIYDIIANRAINEHIAPVINRLKARHNDLNKIITTDSGKTSLWENSNFIVIDLKDVNISMKKVIPLLLSKYIYDFHKNMQTDTNPKKYMNIIIDEAHNILSSESFREAESWKDYRLETFEEIIKEGRKFGVFMTIASQRPSDISPTIISQAHNYFIHRLINIQDLKAVETSVSYIDKITASSIPTLPVGTCIFNGISTPLPILVSIDKLENLKAPNSNTICITDFLT